MKIDTDILKEAIIELDNSRDLSKITISKLAANTTSILRYIMLVNEIERVIQIEGIMKRYMEILKREGKSNE